MRQSLKVVSHAFVWISLSVMVGNAPIQGWNNGPETTMQTAFSLVHDAIPQNNLVTTRISSSLSPVPAGGRGGKRALPMSPSLPIGTFLENPTAVMDRFVFSFIPSSHWSPAFHLGTLTDLLSRSGINTSQSAQRDEGYDIFQHAFPMINLQ